MDCLFDLGAKEKEIKKACLKKGWMKGQGETGRGGSQERERERQGGRRREGGKGGQREE